MKKAFIFILILIPFYGISQISHYNKVVLNIRTHDYGFEYDSITHIPFYIRNNAIQRIEFLSLFGEIDILFNNEKNEIPARKNHPLHYFFVIDFYNCNKIIKSIYMEYNGSYEIEDFQTRKIRSFKGNSEVNKVLNMWIFPNTARLKE